ncbi:MAG: class I SAM-dependent methyltransferase, partial [Chloroflexota bacterium]
DHNFDESFLNNQQAYYNARSAEYDDWFYRRGRYDRGPEINQVWHDEAAMVRKALATFNPTGGVLELACGTGIWTVELAKYSSSITAVDGSAEMLAINQAKLQNSSITYQQADLFNWQPGQIYDVVFFSFWLSHVPEDRFVPFWDAVKRALKPNGRVFLIDSLPKKESRSTNNSAVDASSSMQKRLLNNGNEYLIVKRYYELEKLSGQLNKLGWNAAFEATPEFFFYGSITPCT